MSHALIYSFTDSMKPENDMEVVDPELGPD